MRKNWFVDLLLLFFSICIALGIAETILRFTRYRYYFSQYPAGYFRQDPVSAVDITENYPATIFHDIEYDCTVWSNGLGCFDRPYEGEKDYILLVGDSFTFGHIKYEDNYAAVLEKYLGYRILKCGVPGYGPIQELLKAKKIIGKTKTTPNLLIVAYYMGNDLEDDFRFLEKGFVEPERTEKAKVEKGKIGSLLAHPKTLTYRFKNWVRDHFVLYQLINKNKLIKCLAAKASIRNPLPENFAFATFKKYPALEKLWQFHLANIQQIKEFADTNNSRLLFILIPVDFQVYDFLRMSGDCDFFQPNRILADFFKNQSIDYLDLTPLLHDRADQRPRRRLDNRKDLYWNRDSHWNEKGNRLAALLIAKYIIDHNLLVIQEKEDKQKIIANDLRTFLFTNP